MTNEDLMRATLEKISRTVVEGTYTGAETVPAYTAWGAQMLAKDTLETIREREDAYLHALESAVALLIAEFWGVVPDFDRNAPFLDRIASVTYTVNQLQ